ncbi:uncharacterized protein F4822DRAFT_20253 [Hypoxylon trugodes]|uniref:uncharacterized protein n=1 Tax=Hypoxylon trugodes TaxID=326681 RepID=UPI002198E344|nr:uncharacterized protein F4822DRAFT_20253 [Hypoxylon trugodes]KAI1393657.1 hypothetical protein F4822DRAFT_20253 [Hypoxylon trugodes]
MSIINTWKDWDKYQQDQARRPRDYRRHIEGLWYLSLPQLARIYRHDIQSLHDNYTEEYEMVMAWFGGQWLPTSIKIYTDIYGDNGWATCLFIRGLRRLAGLRYELGRFDDVLKTISFYDIFTAERDWRFTRSMNTVAFWDMKNWDDAAATTEEFLSRFEKYDKRDIPTCSLRLVDGYLNATPPEKTRAKALLSGIVQGMATLDGPLSEYDIDIRRQIISAYCVLESFDEAYGMASQLLQYVWGSDIVSRNLHRIEETTGLVILETYHRDERLGGHSKEQRLELLKRLMESLLIWWERSTPETGLLSRVIEFYVIREAWDEAH